LDLNIISGPYHFSWWHWV